MLILKNNSLKTTTEKHWLLTGAFLLSVILGSKIDLDLGGLIAFTLQTLFLGLAYFYLPILNRITLILVYLLLGIIGLPVFNGGVGLDYILSCPFGFFLGFILAGFIPVHKNVGFYQSFLFFMVIHFLILSLGVLWLWYYDSLAVAVQSAKDLSLGMIVKSTLGAFLIFIYRRLSS